MSAHCIPARVKTQLAEHADTDCDICHGDGYVTYTARTVHGEEEVACGCVERDAEPVATHTTCVCGGGFTFDFAAGRVYCRTCEV